MILTGRNPRFGMEKEVQEDGGVIPLKDIIPNTIIIEMTVTPENECVEERCKDPDMDVWFEMLFSFRTLHGVSIFTHELGLLYNFTRKELLYFVEKTKTLKEALGFYPIEPYGFLEVNRSGGLVDLQFNFDANHYLFNQSSFGSSFFIAVSVTHEMFEKFVEDLKNETRIVKEKKVSSQTVRVKVTDS